MAKSKRKVRKSFPAADRAAAGESLRRRVLGDAYVDASLKAVDDLNADFMPLIHEWVWHDIWGRPGLDLKTRSLINIGVLTAINRPRELKIHLRGAINNGVTIDEIREVLMHTSLYAGVPATLDGIHTARETLTELGLLASPASKKSKKSGKRRTRKSA